MEDELGATRGTRLGGERCLQGFGWESRSEETTGPRRSWGNNIILDRTKIEVGGANWIQLTEDTVQWRVFLNTVMNLRVP